MSDFDIRSDDRKTYITMPLVIVRERNGQKPVTIETIKGEWIGRLGPRALPRWMLDAIKRSEAK